MRLISDEYLLLSGLHQLFNIELDFPCRWYIDYETTLGSVIFYEDVVVISRVMTDD